MKLRDFCFFLGTRAVLAAVIVTMLSSAPALGQGGLQVETTIYQPASEFLVATVGDFNGDGFPDIAVVSGVVSNTGPATIHVFLGKGDGTFANPSIDTSTTLSDYNDRLAVGDFNRDGKLDLVQANASGIMVAAGNGDGTFQPVVVSSGFAGSGANSVVVGDLDGDGNPDVVASTGASPTQLAVLLGNGNGTFHQVQTSSTVAYSMVLADLNGDHLPDLIYVGNPALPTVELNNGNGTFGPAVAFPLPGYASAVAVADANGDGKLDLIISGADNTPLPYIGFLGGNGDGSFQSVATSPAVILGELAVADIDGDGKVDVILGDPTGSSLAFARGSGNGMFQGSSTIPGAFINISGTLLVSDLNRDGAPDIVTYSPNLPAEVGALLNCKNGCTNIALTVPSIATYGSVPLSATVTPRTATTTPTGNVSFYINSPPPAAVGATASLVDGTATANASTLAPGPYKFYALYAGDATYSENRTDIPTMVLINPAASSTGLTVTPTSIPPGQSVTIKAQVSSTISAIPAGQVTLQDGGTGLVVLTLDQSGAASYSSSNFSAGHHSLTWAYGGSTFFAASTSPAVDLFVGPPDFSLAPQPGGTTSQTVTPGQTATYNLSLAPVSGFTGTVALSCSGAPQNAACSVQPAAVSLNGTAATPFIVSVVTTAQEATPRILVGRIGPSPSAWFWPWTTAALLASAWFAMRWRRGLALVVPVVALLLLNGCGGGSQPTNPGTPLGKYNIVISATSGTTTHIQNLTLTVN